MPIHGSAWIDGERRAVVVAGDRVGVTSLPGLDAAIVAAADLGDHIERWVDPASVHFDAPLRPPVIFCLGQNYDSHVREKGIAGHAADARPSEPEFFLKAGQTIADPEQPFQLDESAIRKLDYETELGVVIGSTASRVSARDALDHVYGYLVVNDLSARERQIKTANDGTKRMAADAAKNFDTATWFSTHVVTRDAVPDPGKLEVTTTLNGSLRQKDTTASLIVGVAELVSYVSYLITLQAGAVIATGTPGGTGWSMDPEIGGTGLTPAGCEPGRYLRPGDELVSRVSGVGELRINIVMA